MKRILFILNFIAFVTVSQAQQFKVGAVAGVAITDVQGFNGTEIPTFRKGGLIAGGIVNTYVGGNFRVQLEITYTQRGSQIVPDSTHLNNYYLLALNYVDVSLMIRKPIHMNINHKMSDKYGLILGLTYGQLIYQGYELQSVNYDISSEINNYEANAFIGFYYNFTPNFFFDFRYSNTFLGPIKHVSNPSSGIFYPYFNSWNDGNNLAFELRLGITFGGGASSSTAVPGDAAPAPTPSPQH